jgi:hypothetical protein
MSDQNEKLSDVGMKDDARSAAIRQKLSSLKQDLIRQKEQVREIGDLVKKKIETHYDVELSELSGKELDQEMGRLLTFLNENIDCLSPQKITSHRKIIGKFIVLAKKMTTGIIRPVLGAFLEKQRRFNESAVRFQLASFIRHRKIEQRLEAIEKIVMEIEDQQDALLDAVRSLSKRSGENGSEKQ